MWKATIRGLLARRVRLALTAMAVLLGVSFVSATYVLTDTVKRSFDSVFSQTLAGVDLQVQGPRVLGTGDPPRIPERTLEGVRQCGRLAPGLRPNARSSSIERREHRWRRAPAFNVVDRCGPFRLVDDGGVAPRRR
jgi:hypothetical protein